MSDFDIDKLIRDGIGGGAARDAFTERVLQESTAALARGRASRNRMRATGLTLCIMLIVAGAFICGRMSIPGQVLPEQEGWTNVPGDLVAWLDAGRFFEQLGMDERAERAYQMASEFIPTGNHEIDQAGIDNSESLLGVLANVQLHPGPKGLAELDIPPETVSAAGRVSDWSNKKPSLFEILQQYLKG